MSSSTGIDLDRRALLQGAAGAGVAVAALGGTEALAQDRGALKDAKVTTATVSFQSGGATTNGFLARPAATGKYGAVILMPGIFGVTDYMKEATAQVAQAGLVGLCVDWYTQHGGTPKTNDFAQLREVVARISDRQILGDLQAGIDYLKKHDFANGKYGVTGFCMGGRYALLLAAQSPDIVACSPYYGPVTAGGPDKPAAMDMTAKIKAAVQGHYGATDMNPKPDDVRAFYAKLKETNPHAEFYIYEGAGHAFHDFSRPSFNREAATTAWNRTLDFFGKNLK